MTQTVRPPVTWIVPVPADDPYGDRLFTIVCRGNSDLGKALNYFLYAISKEVESNKKLDLSKGFVTIKRNLTTIADFLKVSQKTAISYIRQLATWKFITPHGYHHTYDVYFDEVINAISNPPAPEWPKRRGKYAQQEDCKDGKSTNHAKDLPDSKNEQIARLEARIVDLETEMERMVNLQTRIVDLETWRVNLQSQKVNLSSLQSSEGTPQVASDRENDSLLLLTITRPLGNDYITSASADDTQPSGSYEGGYREEVTIRSDDVSFPISLDELEATATRLLSQVFNDEQNNIPIASDATQEQITIGNEQTGEGESNEPNSIRRSHDLYGDTDGYPDSGSSATRNYPGDTQNTQITHLSGATGSLTSSQGVNGRSEDKQGSQSDGGAEREETEQNPDPGAPSLPTVFKAGSHSADSTPSGVEMGSTSLPVQDVLMGVSTGTTPTTSILNEATKVNGTVQETNDATMAKQETASQANSTQMNGSITASTMAGVTNSGKRTPKPATSSPSTKETGKNGKNKKEIELTLQEKIFWGLWCDVWFNQDIPPKINETAYEHIQKLARFHTTAETLNNHIDFTRKQLEDRGIKRKVVHLGNLVSSYPDWKQTQKVASNGHGSSMNGKSSQYVDVLPLFQNGKFIRQEIQA